MFLALSKSATIRSDRSSFSGISKLPKVSDSWIVAAPPTFKLPENPAPPVATIVPVAKSLDSTPPDALSDPVNFTPPTISKASSGAWLLIPIFLSLARVSTVLVWKFCLTLKSIFPFCTVLEITPLMLSMPTDSSLFTPNLNASALRILIDIVLNFRHHLLKSL